MYDSYFKLTDLPFTLAPDPRFVFLSTRHREALAHLLYGMGESGGFVQLTGEVGTGKTTICRTLLHQLPQEIRVALIFNPVLTVDSLLQTMCQEFCLDLPDEPSSVKALMDTLYAYLLAENAEGRRPVLIIDEAQNLTRDVLEQVRLLTNLETDEKKLLQVFLIGQPELRTLLASSDLRQLAQRITARYHLEPLNLDETKDYIEHRLKVVGCEEPLFTARAMRRIHRLTNGIPRLINVLCDRALLGAYTQGLQRIGPSIVRRAYREVQGRRTTSDIPPLAWAGAGLAGIALALSLVSIYQRGTVGEWINASASRALPPAAVTKAEVPQTVASRMTPGGESTAQSPPPKATAAPVPAGVSLSGAQMSLRGAANVAVADLAETNREGPKSDIADSLSATPAGSREGAGLPLTASTNALGSLTGPTVDVNAIGAELIDSESNDAGLTSPEPNNPEVVDAEPANRAEPALVESASGNAEARPAIEREVDTGATSDEARPLTWSSVLAGTRASDAGAIHLAQLWSLPGVPAGARLCEWVREHELACHIERGDWAAVARLDLPALLRMTTGREPQWVLLRGLSATDARVVVDSIEYRFPREELTKTWDGSFQVLWRPPSDNTVLRRGDRGEGVEWLQRRLAQIDGVDLTGARNAGVYDWRLLGRIRNFQQLRGIGVDGVAGPETLIHLMAATRPRQTPRLKMAPVRDVRTVAQRDSE
ncbi:MAG: AAA family ATPase [Pseudomonadota bacterium]